MSRASRYGQSIHGPMSSSRTIRRRTSRWNHCRCLGQRRRACAIRRNPVSKDKILVVEDAPDISSLLKIYFTSQGYEVMTAMRGQVALEICRKTPPNLALLDVN